MATKTAPAPSSSVDVLDTLVAQFTDPLACLRELIQNALDAGSDGVDVGVSEEGASVVVEVVDHGSGMDRATIDNQLTRLFSSSKDGDLTKIGKFGIGFVSVFALKPTAVCVDTAKAGECWRIVFAADRTFTRVKLDEAMEGTRVRLFLDENVVKNWGGIGGLKKAARATIKHWCRYVAHEITFDGAAINEQLSLPHRVTATRDDQQGTVVVVGIGGISQSHEGAHDTAGIGFYNKGLTLLEAPTWPDTPPGVAVRISSRWLEHTLTRDSVVRDDRYLKAMALVNTVVDDELAERAQQTLEQLGAVVDEDGLALRASLVTWFTDRKLSRAQKKRPLFCAVGGARCSANDLKDDGAFVGSVDDLALAEAVAAAGHRVILVSSPHFHQELNELGVLCGATPHTLRRLRGTFIAAQAVDGNDAPRAARLAEMTRDLLTQAKVFLKRKVAVRRVVGWHKTSHSARPFFFASDVDGAVRVAEGASDEDARALVADVGHPAVAELVGLGARDPVLAAFLFAKLLVPPPLSVDADTALATAAWQLRQHWSKERA